MTGPALSPIVTHRRLGARPMVVGLLCLMYMLTYVDRVNIGAAADPIKQTFDLSNAQLGFVMSAFAYPYLLCQLIGGRVADRFGARATLFVCGLVWALGTVATGLAGGMVSLLVARLVLGLGEGATFPAATQAMQHWIPARQRGFVQGLTHAFSRFGNAVTPPLVALLTISFGWRGSFVIIGVISAGWAVAWLLYFRNDPRRHPQSTPAELEEVRAFAGDGPKALTPWRRLFAKMWPVTLTYFCYGWTLWIYLNWLPSFFKNNYHMDITKSALFASGVFVAGILGDMLGGTLSDAILKRTGKLRLARLTVVVGGLLGAACSLLPLLFLTGLVPIVLCLTLGFFCAELVIGPMWAVPMDLEPDHCGTAAGIMNIGSASAAIISPVVGGYLVDVSGNWTLPFLVSIAISVIGAVLAFRMPLGGSEAKL